eukprot:3031573-Heterocapsa_arctica.AAC.1
MKDYELSILTLQCVVDVDITVTLIEVVMIRELNICMKPHFDLTTLIENSCGVVEEEPVNDIVTSTNVLVCEKTHEAVRAVLPAPQVQTKLCFTYLAEGCAPTSVQLMTEPLGVMTKVALSYANTKMLLQRQRVDDTFYAWAPFGARSPLMAMLEVEHP